MPAEEPTEFEAYHGPDGRLYFRPRCQCAKPAAVPNSNSKAAPPGIRWREHGRIFWRGFIAVLCDWRLYALIAAGFCLDVFIRRMSHG